MTSPAHTMDDLDRLLANATPAPWGREDFTPLESDYSKIGHCNVILAPDGMSIVADLMKDPDIELVLAMHATLPSLLARIRELEAGHEQTYRQGFRDARYFFDPSVAHSESTPEEDDYVSSYSLALNRSTDNAPKA